MLRACGSGRKELYKAWNWVFFRFFFSFKSFDTKVTNKSQQEIGGDQSLRFILSSSSACCQPTSHVSTTKHTMGQMKFMLFFLSHYFAGFFQPTCPARFTPDQLLYLLKMKKTCCLYTLELYKLFSIEISKKDGQKSCNRFSFKS